MDDTKNIYQVYTDNVAPLTPMIAEQLKMDEDEYGSEEVMDAIRIAVMRNIKNMKYIEAILRNKKSGIHRDDRTSDAARRKYAEIP